MAEAPPPAAVNVLQMTPETLQTMLSAATAAGVEAGLRAAAAKGAAETSSARDPTAAESQAVIKRNAELRASLLGCHPREGDSSHLPQSPNYFGPDNKRNVHFDGSLHKLAERNDEPASMACKHEAQRVEMQFAQSLDMHTRAAFTVTDTNVAALARVHEGFAAINEFGEAGAHLLTALKTCSTSWCALATAFTSSRRASACAPPS